MMTSFFKRLLAKLASKTVAVELQCFSLDNASLVFNTLMRFFSGKSHCYQVLEQGLKKRFEDGTYDVIFKARGISRDIELEAVVNKLLADGACSELKKSCTSV